MTSISYRPGQLGPICTQLAQLLPRLPIELHLQILGHLPLLVLLYLASRCSHYSKLITPATLDRIHPGTDPLTAVAISLRRQYRRPSHSGPSDLLYFLTPTNACITLRTFRMRLFLLERTHQSQDARPSVLICYTCFVAKPPHEFQYTQTKGRMSPGGSAAIGRICLDCEEERFEEENSEEDHDEKENAKEENAEKENAKEESDEKEHFEEYAEENAEEEHYEKKNAEEEHYEEKNAEENAKKENGEEENAKEANTKEEHTDEKESDEKESDEKESDEKESDEKESDEKESDEKESDEKESDEKESDEKESDEKESDKKENT